VDPVVDDGGVSGVDVFACGTCELSDLERGRRRRTRGVARSGSRRQRWSHLRKEWVLRLVRSTSEAAEGVEVPGTSEVAEEAKALGTFEVAKEGTALGTSRQR